MDKPVFLKFAKETFVNEKRYILDILNRDRSNSDKVLEILQKNKEYFDVEDIINYKKGLRALVSLSPRDFQKHLGKALIKGFDLLNAKDVYKKLLDEEAELEVLNNYACVCIKLGIYEEALEVFKKYYKEYIDYNLYYNYIKALLTKGLTEDAVKVVSYYATKGEKSKALFLYGKVKSKMGEYIDSFKLFEESLLNERDENCLKEYISLLITVQKYDKAIDVIEKYYSKDSVEYHYNRAKVYHKNKLLYEAIDELEKSLVYTNNDAESIIIYTFIARLYRENHEVLKGIQYIRKAQFIKNSGSSYSLLLELAKLNKASGNMVAYKDNLTLILDKFKEAY